MTASATSRAEPFSPRARSRDRESLLRRVDWLLLGAVLALCALGSLLIWSATKQQMISRGLDPQTYFKKDLLNIAIGVAIGGCTALVDYRALRAYAPIVYLASVLGLVVVLSPLGATINGAHSWLLLPGGFQIQPSEFAKVAVVVGMAMILAEKRDAENEPRDGDVLLVLALAAVPLALILLQPDFGTMMVLVFTIFGVLAVAGAPTRWVVGLLLLGLLAGFAILHFGLLSEYQRARFTSFTDPGRDVSAAGYNANQARIAIGSGGIFGKGLFHGTQTNGSFIPEQQTDFVFTVAGEELGLLGAGAIIVLLGIVLWRTLRIAQRCEEMFGTLVAAGVVSWFAFQSFVNVGMTLGIMPVTGLPLPFVSYGGSSMFANLLAIGLVMNVHIRSADT